MCLIYKASGGSCDRTIGPLNENQAHIPMQLYWPEGQPTLIERLEHFQTHLVLASPDDLLVDGETSGDEGIGGNKPVVMSALSKEIKDQVDAVETKVDVVETKVDVVETKVDVLSNKMEDKVDAVETKVDAVETKVDAVETKVDVMKAELKEVKDLMYKLMAAMTKEKE